MMVLEAESYVTSKMNILLSAYACRPNAGSELGTGWNWAVHLAETGSVVHVLTAGRNRQATEAYQREHPSSELHFHFIDVPWMNPMASGARHYLAWQWMALRRARVLSRSVDFDVVQHVSYGSVHLPTPLWRLAVPTIFGPVGGGQTTPPSLLPYFGEQARTERWRTRVTQLLPHLPFYRKAIRRMSVVLAANRNTMELVKQAGCRRVELLCDTGLRMDFSAESPRSFNASVPLRLLWVGRFMHRKGVELALDALQQTTSNIHLTLVGDGLEEATLRRMIVQRGLEGRVFWAGKRLPWLEVRQAYLNHDALLFTSLRDSFGSQLLEAMSLGLPVIALNLGGAQDFIPPRAGIKIDIGATATETVERLSSALNRFAIMTVEERNAMSEEAWRKSQDCAWPVRAAFAVGLFEEILHQKK
jgi:glycosyltransferase involved in cell wall biosynthesis